MSRRGFKLLITAFVFISVACAGTAYRRVAEIDDPHEYKRFLERYPEGSYAQKAHENLRRWRAFDATRKENTPAAYRRFLEKYPEGKTALKAERYVRALELMEKAHQAIKSGKKAEARSLLEKAVTADPDNQHILVRAGALALEGNLAGEAVAWFNEAVRLNTDNYRTRAMLVVALLKAARAAAAVEEARAILQASPKDRYVYEVLTKVFIAAKLFDIAAAVIENEIQVFGPEKKLVLAAARAYLSAGAPTKALKILDEIQRDSSGWAEAVYLTGKCYLGLADYARAHETFTTYIYLHPNEEKGFYRDGIALERLGRFNEAIGRYGKAAKLNPSGAHIIRRLAILNLITRDVKAAKKFFKSYLELMPDGPMSKMARRVIAGEMPGYKDIHWGADAATLKRLMPHVRKKSSSGREAKWCEIGNADFAGFDGRRCFVFKNDRLIEVRLEAKLGDIDRVRKVDLVIKKLKSIYGAPISEKPRVSRFVTDEEATTTSEIAWNNPDGLAVLKVICISYDTGASGCDFVITWAPG